MCPKKIPNICLDCPKFFPGVHLEPKSVPYRLSLINDTVCMREDPTSVDLTNMIYCIFPPSGSPHKYVVVLYFQVPLWVALNLRQRQKCRIVQPEWMTPERLEAARDAIQ